ncbi:tRNA lysidine(34) synthetase TilS [Halpernia frigidisoli]|uniref:tRNA(Ile)-lysidine synthase n=1 Tax=Halpernia frigidisoli TaxID=1125876 RepID=A0A1I3HZ56_9FLAO|nr:tRNA lysidine(34) synthetase TilS [Halpernia frigidisoli]SFI40971.1 tRNA(Ile)-lysidine synthase [Halpernia frigidisoli]
MYLNKQNAQNELSLLLPNFADKSFLLAISGGADSMVLANLFLALNLNFQIAHINYKLRGEESDLDEKIVFKFCLKNNVKFHLYKVSEIDKKPENSVQLWARNLRYEYFNKIKSEENLHFIVTAHHLNDELETFIINLSRASGLKGLSGIPKNENEILRPLLKFSKEEIYKFAKENNIEFREDTSNQKSDYLRNFIRNEITPQLLKTNESFLENFSKSLTYLNDSKDFISTEIENKRKNLSQKINSKIIFNKEKLDKESDFVKFELLKTYGFDDANEISKIFKSENSSLFYSKGHQLQIARNELIIEKINLEKEDFKEILLPEISQIYLKYFLLSDNFNNEIWKIDLEKIKLPLKIREVKRDDLLFPIGMIGKKKVSKVIKELKLSTFDEEKIKILSDSKDQVLGILPYRQDSRFVANENLKNFIEIIF